MVWPGSDGLGGKLDYNLLDYIDEVGISVNICCMCATEGRDVCFLFPLAAQMLMLWCNCICKLLPS